MAFTFRTVYDLCLPELPVFPTVTAKVTFQAFRWMDEGEPVPDSKFVVPSDYTEDPHRFTDL